MVRTRTACLERDSAASSRAPHNRHASSTTRRQATAILGLVVILSSLPGGKAALAAPDRSSHFKPVLGTLVLQGRMTSAATLTMTGGFSVGEMTSLDWDLPVPTSLNVSGYSQTASTTFSFNVPPTSAEDLTAGNTFVRRFHWDSPPSHTVIQVTETVRATVTTDMSPFTSHAAYPLASVPATLAPFLAITPVLQLPDSVAALVDSFKHGRSTERQVVEAVANWVSTQVHYDPARTNGPFEASWVLAHRTAACRGWADLMASLLRRLGIPTKTEFGWVLGGSVNMPGPSRGQSSVTWGNPSGAELHAWLQVWFPDVGWVPFDPQLEKFFVDPRHVTLFSRVDAGADLNLGAWTAEAGPDENASATGAPLANGSIEIVPGNGLGTVFTAHAMDDFHLHFTHLKRDVKNIMFSR